MKHNMKTYKCLLILLFWLIPISQSFAIEALKLQKIADNVYAIVGELGNRTPENLGNNATFGLVVTSEGVVLIDSGGTYKGAKEIHHLIKSVTDKPITTVINTGGQDHRWLGNGYFKDQGAKLIASKKAVEDQKARTQDQFIMLGNLVGDEGIKGTDAVYAEQTFDDKSVFELGGLIFEISHTGQAHTPGDRFVWLPQQKVMFTGDIVYTQRMLGVGSQSNSKSWINVYISMAAYKPKIIG
jgi:glyoxylase-like metal-dependent hydrolase (beta-lactamase superfamily II)